MAELSPDWVGDWSGRRASLSPERVGLVDATTGTEYTYAELDERAEQTAAALAAAGVAHGDHVLVVSRNRPALVDLFFATGKLGAVLAPVSHRLAPPELEELAARVDPTAMIIEESVAELSSPLHAGADEPEVFVIGEQSSGDQHTSLDGTSLAAAREHASETPTEPSVSLSDPHLLLHTGGSTGTPKETVVPHRAVYWNSMTTIAAWGLRQADTTPMPFPMFHTGGWNVLTVPLFHVGGTVIIAREFDPGEVLRLLTKRDATVLVAVPAVLRMMATHEEWETTDLSSLRFAKSGGGPCRRDVLETWWDRGVDLSQGYGLTECGPNNFAMPDNWPQEKAAAVGVPGPHVSARIVDDGGTPVPAGDVGELELSSPAAADCYLAAPDESQATFGGGWVSTGDLARVDSDGYYYIEGRKKNMFVSGGENVYPAEVEDALTDHPDIEEAIVIGVPDETWGTVGRAVIKGDGSLTIETLEGFLDDRLARFKHPKTLAFVDEFPHAGPSKIDREAIKSRFGKSS